MFFTYPTLRCHTKTRSNCRLVLKGDISVNLFFVLPTLRTLYKTLSEFSRWLVDWGCKMQPSGKSLNMFFVPKLSKMLSIWGLVSHVPTFRYNALCYHVLYFQPHQNLCKMVSIWELVFMCPPSGIMLPCSLLSTTPEFMQDAIDLRTGVHVPWTFRYNVTIFSLFSTTPEFMQDAVDLGTGSMCPHSGI